MREAHLKYLFWSSAIVLLVAMAVASQDAGISCDEILHYGQSVKVYNYFASGGEDKSSLADSDLNLKYYGQSYDNIVTFVTKWLRIENIYSFRNLMSALMGWLTILITALFARWMKNYLAALFVLVLFAVSPFFIGHSYNNLKDIPFAFAYVTGVWFVFRFLDKPGKVRLPDVIILTLSIAFCISIRAGGIILICYLFFFFMVFYFFKYYRIGKVNSNEIIRKMAWILVISLVAFLLSSLLWPYALQDPFRNIIDSYEVMAHYPATFRQLFEARVEWSDYMPWYYLLKSMAITIPVIVLLSLVVFFIFLWRNRNDRNVLLYLLLVFTIIFPLIFVMLVRSNLYSSWRQFLFVYPGIVIISSAGLALLIESIKMRVLRILIIVILLLLTIHPVRFILKNHPYEYIYYNELAGGVRGAFGRYELDYYFTSQAEASEWLMNYIKDRNIKAPLKVSATYDPGWYFRNAPDIEVSWLRYEERSLQDWDYAIIVNRYIPPFQLKNRIWPPENTIKTIDVEGVPVCAILERRSKADFQAYQCMNEGNFNEAAEYFLQALKVNDNDEMIFYNFAGVLYRLGQYDRADSLLKKGLGINPDSELILMYLGNIANTNGMHQEATEYYRKVINVNRKYFDAYVELSGLVAEKDISQARELLRTCLRMNPGYKKAIIALGDTYIKSNPEIARKYYEQAERLK